MPTNTTRNNFPDSLKLRVAFKKCNFYSSFHIICVPTERGINYLKTVPFSLAFIIIFHLLLCRIKPSKTTHRAKYCGGKLLLMPLMVAPCVCLFSVKASMVGAPEAAWWGVSAGLELFQYRISLTQDSHRLFMKTADFSNAEHSLQENNR